jgi:hypothetical protein
MFNYVDATRCSCGYNFDRKELATKQGGETSQADRAMWSSEIDDTQQAANVCRICGNLPERGYDLPLCSNCRKKLSQRPFPTWLKGSAVLVTMVIVLSLSKFPTSLAAGIAFERGNRATLKGNHTIAAVQYQNVADIFPNSTLALARSGIAYYKAGNLHQAISVLQKLGGRKASKQLVDEVNQTIKEIEATTGDTAGRR